ncbi:sensor histidine kinase [Marinicrinis lubricantis]|uniref:Sensor histidine kinase n=1 Tax=Marinicrinis lubricantis TaxID=2086470 RepID=A0ABW1IPD1_9BACL
MARLEALTIKQRLFLIIVCLVCLPSFVLGWIWYKASTETIEQSAIESNLKLIEQTSDFLDLYMSNLEVSTSPYVTNPHVQQFIHQVQVTPYDYLLLSNTIQNDLFSQMLDGRPDILGISITSKNNYHITEYSRFNEWIDMDLIRQRNEQLIRKESELSNFQIIGLNQVGQTSVLTVARKIYSNTTYLFEGLFVLDIDLKQISSISENAALDGFQVWIMDSDGRIVYHPDEGKWGDTVPADFHRSLLRTEEQFFTNKNSNGKQFILFNHSNVTDWTIIAEIPLNLIIGHMIELRNWSMLAVSLFILFTLAVIAGFSLSITRSLSFLQKLMHRVENGDFSVRSIRRTYKNQEINSLFQSFYHMVSELDRLVFEVHLAKLKEQELIIKQKESALQAMQSHINPHFLYNTLEIINSHAILVNNMEISKMAAALAHMFRYNIGNAKQIVTLEEETVHIRSYLDIQCARYRRLQVELNIDEPSMSEVAMIRLTLQPLIENAFVHGYQQHQRKPTYIGIFGERHPSFFRMLIVDRGGGMTRRVMDEYNQFFVRTDEYPSEADHSLASIGMTNVHERIRLTFGKPYGLHIVESSSEGTIIEITLPYLGTLPKEVIDDAISCPDRR